MLATTDYTAMANGAPAGHTHYGFGTSAIAGGRLFTNGLGVNQVGGATLDGTSSLGPKRVLARLEMTTVTAETGTFRAGGLTMLGAFTILCSYQQGFSSDNSGLGITVFGSRPADTAGINDASFLPHDFMGAGQDFFIEAQYTPGAGPADPGLLEYRAWPDGAAVPAYASTAVHQDYALISTTGGIADKRIFTANGNAQYISLEVEGDFKNPALRLSLYPSGHVHARGAATEDAAAGPLLRLFPDGHVISYGGATIAEGASQASFTADGLDCVAFHPGSLFP